MREADAEPPAAKGYHVTKWLKGASIEELEKWASDPNCFEMVTCATLLAEKRAEGERRKANLEVAKAEERDRLSDRRKALEANPFDPRTEVSADAKHIASRIVTHLWILFVLLPIIAIALLAGFGLIR
jgi:hypothetical protein